MPKLIALLTLALLLPAAPLAEERATTKDAERMVHKAVEYLKKNGKEKAFATFSDPGGPFTYRDLYIFAIDYTGVVIAHPKKDLVGKNDWNRKDSTGKFFTQAMIATAKTKGSGWEEYRFENPSNGKMEIKVAYVEGQDGFFIGCGAFKPDQK